MGCKNLVSMLRNLLPIMMLLWAAAVPAQGFPNRPIHIIVPYGPGTGVDIITRILSPQLTNRLRQSVIDLAFGNYEAPKALVDAGRLRVLAVTSLQRMAVLPQVPAIAESFPGFELSLWTGFAEPAPVHDPANQRAAHGVPRSARGRRQSHQAPPRSAC